MLNPTNMKILILLFALLIIGCGKSTEKNKAEIEVISSGPKIGDVLDSLNGVYVYYNGPIDHVGERNTSKDGYNIGLKYQCVEFIKRYYYQHLKHKMPDSYGNAKDFFDPKVKDGKENTQRGLIQFENPSRSKPMPDDILILAASATNEYGHVAIVSKVDKEELEIIQQNPGPTSPSRATFSIIRVGKRYMVGSMRVLGWLRMKEETPNNL
jgi:surface antigen